MREHMRFFVDSDQVFELERKLVPDDSVVLVQALSS